MTQAEREALIADAIRTAEGRRKLAASMVIPHGGKPVGCPVCGRPFRDLAAHAASMRDDGHRVLEVMES